MMVWKILSNQKWHFAFVGDHTTQDCPGSTAGSPTTPTPCLVERGLSEVPPSCLPHPYTIPGPETAARGSFEGSLARTE